VLHICFLFLPFLLTAQEFDVEKVKEINRQAIQLNREGKFAKAEKLLEDLLRELEKENSELAYKAVTWQTLAKVVMNQGDYDRSFDLARKSLSFGLSKPDSANIADNLNTIGINHYFRSDYDSTTHYYEKSLEIKRKISKDPYSLAVSEYNLGIVYEDLGIPKKALEYYHAAEENLLASKVEKTFLSDVYVGIAHIHFYSGDTERAEFYAEKSLQVGIESYGPDNPNITFIYTSYANILEQQERYLESIELLEKSLSIRRQSYGKDHRWTCETYYDLANVYRLDGQIDKAEELYKKAIEIGNRIGNKQYLAYAKTYLAGLYLEEEKNLEEAEELLISSLDEQQEIFGNKNEVVSEIYSRMANLSRIRKEEDRFFENIEKSLYSCNYSKDSIQQVIAPYHALETILLLSSWYEDRFEEKKDYSYLENAYELLDEQVQLIKHIQRNFSTDRSKINLANEYRKVFESGMNLCWKLYENKSDTTYLEKAFDLSEINRNSTLLSGLRDIQNRMISELGQEELLYEKELRSQLEKVKMDLYYEKSAMNPEKEFLNDLLAKRIQLTMSLDSFYFRMASKYPKYKSLKSTITDTNLLDVQEQLGENSQLLAFFLGQTDFYVFSISKESASFFRSGKARELVESTQEFKKRLTERSEVVEVSKKLHKLLIEGHIDADKRELILVPDNVLNYIPFEILTDSLENHLVDQHAISYSAGARIFLELSKDFFQYQTEDVWVGFAPSYEDDLRLFSNQEEVRAIADKIDGNSFIGEFATRENYLKQNRNYKILHLATHAEIDNNNPLYNKLIFADGDLTASDIYLSDTRAEMAVLSACNTGFGKLEKGEGVMSMARAFNFSGVPSVVMSLWKVPDRSTKEIMLHFYKYLKKGNSKSVALQKAKLEYLSSTEDLALRHPYYWAGFVINGNTEPLDLKDSNPTRIMVLAGLLVLLIGAWLLWFKK
jgi:CHAT domain-containing protein/tetratricopeptide (TPR) repeat protein